MMSLPDSGLASTLASGRSINKVVSSDEFQTALGNGSRSLQLVGNVDGNGLLQRLVKSGSKKTVSSVKRQNVPVEESDNSSNRGGVVCSKTFVISC